MYTLLHTISVIDVSYLIYVVPAVYVKILSLTYFYVLYCSAQRKIYIGGMGETRKTGVLNALTAYFKSEGRPDVSSWSLPPDPPPHW